MSVWNPTRALASLLATPLALALPGALAHAQSVEEPPERVSLPFTLADRPDGTSGGDLQLSMTSFSESDSVFGLRQDLFLQAFSRSGAGVYGTLPLSEAFIVEGDGDSAFGLGNVEAGAAYAAHQGTASFVLRGGLTAPVASSGSDGRAANFINSFGRVSDLVLLIPDISHARLSASGMLRSGNLFARGDFGFDVPVWHGDEVADPETLTHVTVGVGSWLGTSGRAFTAELSTISGYGDSETTIALGAGFANGSYVSLVLPVDEPARGEVAVFKVGFRFGDGAKSTASRRRLDTTVSAAHPSGCDGQIEAWRAERDPIRKTRLYDALPEPCRERLSSPRARPQTPPVAASEPAAEPSEPETQPSEPEAQPGEPETQPGEPETQPSEPETQPGEPEAQPGEPAAEPADPTP